MAYGEIGNTTLNHTSNPGSGTTFILTKAGWGALASGVLKSITVDIHTAGNGLKVKVFRDDGINFLFIGEITLDGLAANITYDIPAWIPVQYGDLLGLYITNANVGPCYVAGGAGDEYSKAGDVVADTLKAAWAAQTNNHAINGKVFKKSGILL